VRLSGVSVEGGGGGGKKSTNAEINMVPMIDLLTCCIAFLLMTAVWVQSGRVQAQQPHGAPSPEQTDSPPPQDQLKIQINAQGFKVGVSASDSQDIPLNEGRWDALREALRRRHEANRQSNEVWIQPDGTVHYDEIIRTMDTVYEVFGPPGGVKHDEDRPTIRFL